MNKTTNQPKEDEIETPKVAFFYPKTGETILQ